MGLLDSFERGLERAVNGAFAKTFKSGLQPVEIASALRRELDTQAAVVSRDRILVPNSFVVQLATADFDRMTALSTALIDELTQLVQQHATAQHYSFAGGISITFEHEPNATQGLVRISSTNVQGTVSWNPVLEIAGKRYPIVGSHTVIGRGSDADITVDDSSISRKHVEVLWDGERAQVKDLGSTNGSLLNGQRVSTAPLLPDSVIEIGRTRIVFSVLAQSARAAQRPDSRNDGPTNTVRASIVEPPNHLGFPPGDGRHR
ncbi:MAG: FhaA domain-containing protein [Microbacteriaceae bacterium]